MHQAVKIASYSRSFINKPKQGFAQRQKLGNSQLMSAERIDEAMARINAAMARIDAARLELGSSPKAQAAPENTGSARIMTLVNAHEKLREEVADTLGELDTLIEELEGE